nr:hypothetical protein [uncultured Peptostreptococcus sp.]
MDISNESIVSLYDASSINDDLLIYRGRFHIYGTYDIKCDGHIYYKVTDPVSINFKASIYMYETISDHIEDLSMEEITIDIPGYKIMNAEIVQTMNGEVYGYINDILIKSKDTEVDYLQFDIINMDKIPGKLVKHNNLVYAARLEFDINEYRLVIDKRYKYNKEMHNNLVSKNGSLITHTGRIYKKDSSRVKTKKIRNILNNLSSALSFMCGRYINIINAHGYNNQKIIYREWFINYSSDYRFVFNWTSTISNYHNIEKFLALMCKKLQDPYYSSAIVSSLDWYIESINGRNIYNNIISIQTALEMLSYVVLVEMKDVYSQLEYDSHPASQNIKKLLKECVLDTKIDSIDMFSEKLKKNFKDGSDLITFFRNSVVHPCKSKHKNELEFEDMWNTILLGINYLELVLLYLINYKGEYSDRFKDISFGQVNLVPWAKNKVENNIKKRIDKTL